MSIILLLWFLARVWFLRNLWLVRPHEVDQTKNLVSRFYWQHQNLLQQFQIQYVYHPSVVMHQNTRKTESHWCFCLRLPSIRYLLHRVCEWNFRPWNGVRILILHLCHLQKLCHLPRPWTQGLLYGKEILCNEAKLLILPYPFHQCIVLWNSLRCEEYPHKDP